MGVQQTHAARGRNWASIYWESRPTTAPIRRAGITEDISTNRTHTPKRPLKPNYVDRNPMGSGRSRGGLRLARQTIALPTTWSRQMVIVSSQLSSEFTIEIVNKYTVCLRRVHDRILMMDDIGRVLLTASG
jgi:hypothetical protein